MCFLYDVYAYMFVSDVCRGNKRRFYGCVVVIEVYWVSGLPWSVMCGYDLVVSKGMLPV